MAESDLKWYPRTSSNLSDAASTRAAVLTTSIARSLGCFIVYLHLCQPAAVP